LLDALDAYVQREKALVSLASHELRTPVAVIAGALDVLEARGSLGEADRSTVARIRRAADEMRTDVEALLKLARRAGDGERAVRVDLAAAAQAVIAELESSAPEHCGRIAGVFPSPSPSIDADPALVRMLLRNLIQNAIRHTGDGVRIELGERSLRIADRGEGLPEAIRARLVGEGDRNVPEDGLGLFIVRLICERLGWLLQIRRSDAGGTELDLVFAPADDAGAGEPAISRPA
jgi:signal transduction histidine kinase